MKRGRAAGETREAAERDAILAALPSAAWVFDAGGYCVYANAAAVRLVGCATAEELLRPLEEHVALLGLTDADGRPLDPSDLPVHAALRGGTATDDEVALRERSSGELRRVRYSAGPVRENGRVVGAVAVAEDVTALWEAQRQREHLLLDLEEKRQLLEMVLENAPMFVGLLRGPDLVVEIANPRFRAFMPDGLVVGRRLSEQLDPGPREALVPELRCSLRSVEPDHFVDRLHPVRRTRDGPVEEGWFTYSRVPLHLPSGDLGLLLVGHETTEEVRTRARLEEALRARDEFLTLFAHELRTPLTALTLQLRAVAALVEPLGSSKEGRDVATFLSGALQSVRRFARLADDLTEATREGPILELEREWLDLRDVILEALEEVQPDARGLGCVVDVQAPRPVLGCWDRRRLRQLAIALLANAVKFGRGHEVEVRLDQDGEDARLVVRNRGVRVPLGQEERVFERYERAVSPLHFGGLGLGLYVARRIVASHGGRITIDSGEEATQVTVTLPTEPVGDAAALA